MLKIALFIGIYSYCILFLGLIGRLLYFPVLLLTVLFFLVGILTYVSGNEKIHLKFVKKNRSRFEIFLIVLLVLATGINIIGALGPELAFDSLWYHLTIPKIFIMNQKIFYIPGNLFYYSLMPKLTEMLYTSSLLLSGEILAKFVHFLFGLLSCIVLFRLSRLYLSKIQSLLVVLLYYTNPVVMWLSTTAFSDLSRTFFELFSLYYYALFVKSRNKTKLLISAVLLGFAIATKILALGTLCIFVLLILLDQRHTILEKIKKALGYIVIALTIPLPWLIISYINTGNPVFPLFSHLGLRNFTMDLLSPITFAKTLIAILLFAPDPINPIYLILLPIVIIGLLGLLRKYLFLIVFSFFTYLMWYATSQSGGSRFLVTFIAIFSLVSYVAVLQLKNSFIAKFIEIVIVILLVSNVSYRAIASFKYMPVLLGVESKERFLMDHLNFSFGDFYDENSDIKKIVGNNVVLMKNTHNLFYVDFPFTIDEWNSKKYKYILYQSLTRPDEKHVLVYKNTKTQSWLYKL